MAVKVNWNQGSGGSGLLHGGLFNSPYANLAKTAIGAGRLASGDVSGGAMVAGGLGKGNSPAGQAFGAYSQLKGASDVGSSQQPSMPSDSTSSAGSFGDENPMQPDDEFQNYMNALRRRMQGYA